MRKLGHARRRWVLTAEIEAELRVVYAAPRMREMSAGLARLSKRTDWPGYALRAAARRLGLQHARSKYWTPKEQRYLEEHLGSEPIWKIARKLGRSRESIHSRAVEMGRSTRVTEGYTAEDLRVCFGVGKAKVLRWMERGLLARGKNERIADEDVIEFLRRHPHEYDLRLVDQGWYKAMLFAPASGGRGR